MGPRAAAVANSTAVLRIETRRLPGIRAAQSTSIEAWHQARVRQRAELEGDQRARTSFLLIELLQIFQEQRKQLRVWLTVADQLAAKLHAIKRPGDQRELLSNSVKDAPNVGLVQSESVSAALYQLSSDQREWLKRPGELETIAIPGLCTGTGGMDEDVAARQMRQAYEEFLAEKRTG